jgi:cytochrome c553
MNNNLPKHIVRLLFLLGFSLLLAVAARFWLTDPSFYKYGQYRADAIPELAAGSPLFKGSAHCRSCHDEKAVDTSGGAHKSVLCEVCHGTSRGHPDTGKMQIPNDTIVLCSNCHEAMPARPAGQPQIVLAEHPSPGEAGSQCHTCHDPHSPADDGPGLEPPGAGAQQGDLADAAASVTELVSKCARCHGKRGEGRRKNPPLAGMDSGEFIEKMNKYKSGTGEKTKMDKYAEPLSDEEIVELARYYENLPATPPEETLD